MNASDQRFYGKYRGVVSDNQDPLRLGRVRARVPAVLGDQVSGWALPCVPYAGRDVGLFLVPPPEANVWIEFEDGEPDCPIWTGCYWAQGDLPQVAATPDVKVLKTGAATVTLDDTPGASAITVETAAGMKLVLDASGVEITTGQAKIKLSGAQVTINDGALEVV